MRDESLSRFRREQTERGLELISAAIDKWLKEVDDPLGLHRTQLQAVNSVLTVAAQELRRNLCDIDVKDSEVAEVYDLCRDYDEAIIWLQRLWEYLKDKFEQRDERNGNAELARLVRAADEVVWSCYHEVLGGMQGKHGPAPLTYIEPEYSPATIQTDEPLPVNLMLKAELEFLDECLQSMPIPVLRLPPTCVEAPWWLVYVAHEIGHHVQYDLDLVSYFREGLAAAARAKGFLKADAEELWGNWGEEIFADVFSITMMGQWALRAMVEAEVGTTVRMVKRKTNYPAPVIRLALMKRVTEKLGLKPSGTLLADLDLKSIADSDPLTKKDYEVVEAAADFALQPLPGQLASLRSLCSFDNDVLKGAETVENWSLLLSSDSTLVLDAQAVKDLKTARQVVCGSLLAWSELALEKDDESRLLRRETIKLQTVEALLQSGPRETRAAALIDGTQPEQNGKTLASLLLGASKRSASRGNAGGQGGDSAVQN